MLGDNGAHLQGMAEEDLKAAEDGDLKAAEEDQKEGEEVLRGCPELSPGSAASTAAKKGMSPGTVEHLERRNRIGLAGTAGKLGMWPQAVQTRSPSRRWNQLNPMAAGL